jgi:hypothetical protein
VTKQETERVERAEGEEEEEEEASNKHAFSLSLFLVTVLLALFLSLSRLSRPFYASTSHRERRHDSDRGDRRQQRISERDIKCFLSLSLSCCRCRRRCRRKKTTTTTTATTTRSIPSLTSAWFAPGFTDCASRKQICCTPTSTGCHVAAEVEDASEEEVEEEERKTPPDEGATCDPIEMSTSAK